MHDVPISVVIICKNAAGTIGRCIVAAMQICSDVVVVDGGSTDGTREIVEEAGARIIYHPWLGFGATKNAGAIHAKHDWILNIDSDETLSYELIKTIKQLSLQNKSLIYAIRRLNYLGEQSIHFGEWQNDWVIRLYHRHIVKWDDAPVHENLLIPLFVKVKRLNGTLHHHTANDIHSYQKKLDGYALLVADKYYARGKQAYWFNIWLSPPFVFFKNYLLRFGWLDRKAGWHIARAHAHYTFKKYKLLKNLYKKKNRSI